MALGRRGPERGAAMAGCRSGRLVILVPGERVVSVWVVLLGLWDWGFGWTLLYLWEGVGAWAVGLVRVWFWPSLVTTSS